MTFKGPAEQSIGPMASARQLFLDSAKGLCRFCQMSNDPVPEEIQGTLTQGPHLLKQRSLVESILRGGQAFGMQICCRS